MIDAEKAALALRESLKPRLWALYVEDLDFDLLAERDKVIVSVWSRPTNQSRRCVLRVDEWDASHDRDALWDSKIEALLGDMRVPLHEHQRRIIGLEKVLRALVAEVEDYERVNNLHPNPGRSECWGSVAAAKAILDE